MIPTVDIGPDSALDCDTPVMTIDGSNSSSGTEFSYLWTTVDGNITSVIIRIPLTLIQEEFMF